MANTPKYTFTTPDPYNAAISGGMTALGGIMAEKASSKKSADQLNNFASVLRQEGLVGDAMIYEQMALAQEPDFVTAALTGKPTDRSLTQPFDHALKIFDRKATNEARLKEANARAGEMDDYRRSMARRDDVSDERSLYGSEINDLRTRIFKIDDQIDKAKDAGKPNRVRSLKEEKNQLEGRIQELGGSIRSTLEIQKRESENIGGSTGTGATNVGTGEGVPTSQGSLDLPIGVGNANQGTPLLDFGSVNPENKTPIGEQELPQGAVASPATIPPFDKASHLGDVAEEAFGPRTPTPSIASLPSPSVAASQTPAAPLNIRDLDSRPVDRSRGLPGAPQRQRYDATEQLTQAADEFRAASAPAIDFDTEFAGPPIPEIRDPRFVGPIEVRRALPVEEEGGMLSNLGATPAEEGKGVLRTPDAEVYKALAPEAKVQDQLTIGTPPEEDPDVLEAQEKLNTQRDILIEGFKGVGLDINGKSLAERLTEKAKDIDDLKVVERRLKSFRDNYGEYTDSQSAVEAGEKARRDMPEGDKFMTSVRISPRTGGLTWYFVKKGSITFGSDGRWHGEDGTVWYPDPKTKFMVKVPPGGKPVYETKLENPNVGVSQSEFESDMAKLKNSKIFGSPDLEGGTDKQSIKGLTPGGASATTPTPVPGTPAASKTTTGSTLKTNAETAKFF